MIIESNPKDECYSISYWDEMSKILNAEGPCIETATSWCNVSIII